MTDLNICDKCGEAVEPQNDAVLLELTLSENPLFFLAISRHLFPTEKCPGSPSRAQYFEGQPRDTRGYPYYKEYEEKYRGAYQRMLGSLKNNEEKTDAGK